MGQRVLVIRGEGEIPSIVGVRKGGDTPNRVSIRAKQVSIGGDSVSISGDVSINDDVTLNGQVNIGEVSLEEYIAQVVGLLLGGMKL